jgi:hypothetical protein
MRYHGNSKKKDAWPGEQEFVTRRKSCPLFHWVPSVNEPWIKTNKRTGSKTHCPVKHFILFQNEWKRENKSTGMNAATAAVSPVTHSYRVFFKKLTIIKTASKLRVLVQFGRSFPCYQNTYPDKAETTLQSQK